MPDVYATITEADAAVVERVGEAMEVSAADPQQRAMVAAYLDDLALPEGARVLEVGCGTGAIARELAARPEVAEVVWIDPSPVLLARARELGAGVDGLAFREADGRDPGELDPLQVCVSAFATAYITDRWVVRRLPQLVRAAGFAPDRPRSHGYVQVDEPDYMFSIADRGAEALLALGRIGPDLAQAFKDEAQRRVREHSFFGGISYGSVTATRPT